PGILPAAYIFSSMSTVRGKKSAPSRVSARPTAVARTTVSPLATTTAPSACLASRPAEKVISSPPISTVTTVSPSAVDVLMCLFCAVVKLGGGPMLGLVAACGDLAPQTQLPEDAAVRLDVLAVQVVEEATPPADENQQAAPRVVVLLVLAQVLRELVDPVGHERDLHLGRAGVRLGAAELGRELALALFGQWHEAFLAGFLHTLHPPPPRPRSCPPA